MGKSEIWSGGCVDMGINKPLVSIVSPVYNAEAFVGRMLSSVLSQTYWNIEMICVDDGSEDNTEAVIKSFTDAFAEKNMRLIYLRQEHGGQTRAVSAGLQLVNGEYLSWLDSDDYYLPGKLTAQMRYLREHPKCEIVFTLHEKGKNYLQLYLPNRSALVLKLHA